MEQVNSNKHDMLLSKGEESTIHNNIKLPVLNLLADNFLTSDTYSSPAKCGSINKDILNNPNEGLRFSGATGFCANASQILYKSRFFCLILHVTLASTTFPVKNTERYF